MKRSLKKKKFRKTLADRFKESEMYKNAEIDGVIGEQAFERKSVHRIEKEFGINYGFPSKEEADLWMNSKPVGKEEI